MNEKKSFNLELWKAEQKVGDLERDMNRALRMKRILPITYSRFTRENCFECREGQGIELLRDWLLIEISIAEDELETIKNK